MINGIHHASLATTDLDRMMGFYRDLLGLEEGVGGAFEPGFVELETIVGMKDIAGRATTLKAGNIQIEFFEYHQPVPRPVERRPACDAGIRHLAFDVTDIYGEYRRLAAAGVEFLSEPQLMDNVSVISVYGRDPDGNIFELQEILPASPLDRIPVSIDRS
jgi:catechol 2,3-dioxygenase-like lactoylglutathione lyase family enzyme